MLGVGANTEGTIQLRKQSGAESEALAAAVARLHEMSRDSRQDRQRRQNIAASKRGKARPPEVRQATGRGHKGLIHSAETRRRMSASHRRRGDGGPNPGWPWTRGAFAVHRGGWRLVAWPILLAQPFGATGFSMEVSEEAQQEPAPWRSESEAPGTGPRPCRLDRLCCPLQQSLARRQVGGNVEVQLGGQLGRIEEAGQFGGVFAVEAGDLERHCARCG